MWRGIGEQCVVTEDLMCAYAVNVEMHWGMAGGGRRVVRGMPEAGVGRDGGPPCE